MKSLFKSLSKPIFFLWGQSLAVAVGTLVVPLTATLPVQAQTAPSCGTIYGSYGSNSFFSSLRSYTPPSTSAEITTLDTPTTNRLVATVGVDPVLDSNGRRRIYYMEYQNGTTPLRLFYYDGVNKVNTGITLALPSTTVSVTKSTGTITTSNNGIARMGFAPDGTLYITDAQKTLYRFTPNRSGTGGTISGAITIADNPNNDSSNSFRAQIGKSYGGDIAFDLAGRMYIVTYDPDTNNTNSTEFRLFQISNPQSSTPTAVLLGKVATTDSTAGLAFQANDNKLYLQGTGGKSFSWDLGTNTVTTLTTTTGSTDLGSCTYPNLDPNGAFTKTVTNITNPGATILSANDILEYTLTITNNGSLAAGNVTLVDAIPSGTTYVAGTTKLNGITLTDDAGGTMPYANTTTPKPINSPNQATGVLLTGVANKATVVFRVKVNASNTRVCNQGTFDYDGGPASKIVSDDPNTATVGDQTCIETQTGTISGSLYQDANNDNSFTTGETKLPANIDVQLLNSAGTLITTVQTNAVGDYTFTNVPVATGYQVRVVTSNPQIPTGYVIGTTNPITGIDITTGATVANRNFGFRVPDLSITKTHLGNFTQGQTGATYTVTAKNSGGAATSGTVTVTDTLPSDLVPTAASGTNWTCNISGQTVTCTRSDTLAAGSSYPSITVTVSVVNSAPSNVTNTAKVSGGGQTSGINDSIDDPTIINASATPNPISCDGNFYQIRVAGSGSQLFKINRSVNPYTQTQIGNITPDVALNALGYNKLDGFMYAIKSNTNELYRIDQNGAVFLGTVTGLPAADYNTATIDSAGNYYVKVGTSNSTIYKINVSTRTATTITLDQSIDLGDMAFHPTNGAIYGLRDATLYKIVLSGTTGTVTTIGSTNISGSPSVGSVFFDASGSLYGYENGGTFYSINTTTGNATQVSTAPATSESDGASCAFTSPERVISTVKSVDTVSKVNNTTFDVPYTIVVTNTGTDTAPNTQITENLNLTFSTGSPTLTIPSSPTVTNGSCTANTGFNGTTNTKLLTGSNTLPIGASGTCTIKFTVRVVYPNQGLVPSAAQNNTAYASSTSDSPNPGYTFTSSTPIPPPALLASSQSTVSTTYPATSNVPNLLLVKRITAINGNRTQNPNDATALNTFVNDPSTADDNSNWADRNTFLTGAYNGGKVKPGDEVEYTIYFLNTGAAAKNITLCDRIPDNMTLVPTGYNTASPHPTESGALPTDTGIGFALNASSLPTNPTAYLTNVSDSDRGRYYPPYDSNTPSTCKALDAQGSQTASGAAANTNGAVVVEVVKNTDTVNQLPPATAPGTPTNSYGFIRFKAKVN